MLELARLEELGIKPKTMKAHGQKNAWPRRLEIKCC